MRRHLVHLAALFSLLAVAAAWIQPVRAAESASPQEVIEAFNATLVEAMKKGPEFGFDGRVDLIRPVYERTFAWNFMAGVAAGRHFRSMDAQQKRTYLDAYRDWSVATYADRFAAYKGQRFEVISAETTGERAEVTSRIYKADGEHVDLTYKLRSRGDTWLVVDIQVRGVSQLALTRSQFVATLDDGGYSKLMAQLKDKTLGMSEDITS